MVLRIGGKSLTLHNKEMTMDHYIVSARKYRPSTFGTVIGQKALTATLKHAIATDRLAHAYLFCGSRGVGKTSCARIFAKTINCRNRTPEGEACNECDSCREFNSGTSLNIIELDAASHNGVDDIKALIEQVLVPPTEGRYRVFIIDEVHMLSSAAFNAFLKTLEEPPEYVIFILATTEKHKIIPTILSRCQIYDFNRITVGDMVEHLQHVASAEGITADPAALNVIAGKADGAMRDALSIFDQVAAASMGNITYQDTIENLNILDSAYYGRLIDAFLANDVPSALLIYKEIRDKGFDSQFFINGLALYLRDLMLAYQPSTLPLLEATDEVREQMALTARRCTPTFIYAAMELCNDADLNFRAATNKQFLIELTLVKLCQLTAPRPESTPGGQGLRPVTPAQGAPRPASPAPAQSSQPQAQRPPQPPQTHAQYTPPQTQYTPPPAAHRPPQPRAPQAVRQKPGSLPSFSLNGNRNTAKTGDEADPASEGPAHRRTGAYTEEQLRKVWMEYVEAHPTERILINTMKASLPEKKEGDLYKIAVDDTIQIETINDAKPDILAFIHDKLSNDSIDFTVEQRVGEAPPSTWTQREVLQHMLEKQPQLGKLISDFGLSI